MLFGVALSFIAGKESADVFYVCLVLLFIHILDVGVKCFIAREVFSQKIAVFWDVVADVLRSPVNGDGSRLKAIEDFFSDVAGDVFDVFISKAKAEIF